MGAHSEGSGVGRTVLSAVSAVLFAVFAAASAVVPERSGEAAGLQEPAVTEPVEVALPASRTLEPIMVTLEIPAAPEPGPAVEPAREPEPEPAPAAAPAPPGVEVAPAPAPQAAHLVVAPEPPAPPLVDLGGQVTPAAEGATAAPVGLVQDVLEPVVGESPLLDAAPKLLGGLLGGSSPGRP